jgi:diguanylate cyclase (GGDEF)-like protein
MNGVSIISLAFCALLGYFVVLYRRQAKGAREKALSGAEDPVYAPAPKIVDPLESATDEAASALGAGEQRIEANRPLQAESQSVTSTTFETECLPGSPEAPQELVRYLDELQGAGKAHTLMCLSVDSFNKLKDRYGSAAQDEVLQQLTGILFETLPNVDLSIQCEGEKIKVLLPGMTLGAAEQTARRILDRIADTMFTFEDGDVAAKVNIGLAEAKPGEASKALVGRAEAALQAARRAGFNRACLHIGQPSDPLRTYLRQSQRFSVDKYQRIAPYLNETWSPNESFQEVLCRDLSTGGFAYLVPERPDYKRLVVELGAGKDRKYVVAVVKNCVRVGSGADGPFRVGCMFAGRLERNPEDGTWSYQTSGDRAVVPDPCAAGNAHPDDA